MTALKATAPDAVMLGVYGTVMCSFGPPLACYPFQDPDLKGKTPVILGPWPVPGDTMLGLRVVAVDNDGVTLGLRDW